MAPVDGHRSRVLLLLGTIIVASEAVGYAQTGGCHFPTEDQPIVICFRDPPLNVDVCKSKVTANFEVHLLNPETRYRYAYTFHRNGEEIRYEDDPSSFPFAGDKNLPPLEFELKTSGNYQIDIQVDDKRGNRKIEKSTSQQIHLESTVRAVIVGISKYENGGYDPREYGEGKIRNLRYAEADARAFAGFLNQVIRDEDLSMTVLPNGEAKATGETIMKALKQQAKVSCQNDSFIFYYSGHGFVDEKGRRFLGTYDINPSDISEHGISLLDLGAAIKGIEAKRKLIVLDSCFGGAYAREPTSNGLTGAKLQIVYRGKVAGVNVPPILFEDANPIISINPSKQFSFYSASMANAPAEEGVVVANSSGNRKFFFLWEVDDVQRASVGHGLYTYYLLGELEKQMSAKHPHSDLNHDGVWQPEGECKFNFLSAHHRAAIDIENLEKELKKKGFEVDALQEPTDSQGADVFKDTECKYNSAKDR
jgi:hypothetical protein